MVPTTFSSWPTAGSLPASRGLVMSTFMSEEIQYLDDAKKEVNESSLSGAQLFQLSKNLEGKLLTICDASLPQGVQVKAMKDLVREALRGFRFQAEMVASGHGDEYSIGVPTLDLIESDGMIAFPTMATGKVCACDGINTKCSNCA